MHKSLKYNDMLSLVNKGIGPTKYKGAFNDAKYLGNPGKDLYFWIESNSSSDEMKSIAIALAKQFPSKPPHNPIEYGACLRYIYGMFEKQGVLRSYKDKQRMINEQQSWDASEFFIDLLYRRFAKSKNNFGLAILSEQMAHRLGDKCIMKNDVTFLEPMEKLYCDAYYYAKKCNSKKHLMTTFYWAGKYFEEASQKDKAIEYYRKAIKAANAHCPDARKSLCEKIMDEFKYLKKNDPGFGELLKYWKRKAKHKAVKSVVKSFK